MIIGGAQENTLDTVIELGKNKNYEVQLFSGYTSGPEGSLISKAVSNCTLKISKFLIRDINPIMDFIALIQLYFFIKKNKFDIVHTHSSKAGILGRFAAKLAKTPIIIHTVHGLPFFKAQNKILNKIYLLLEKITARFTHKIICVSPSLIEDAVSAGVGKREKFVSVYSGIELEKFKKNVREKQTLRKKLGFSEHDIVIGNLSRLFTHKGHEFLLQAAKIIMQKYPKTKLLLIGDGILRNKLKILAGNLRIEKNIVFTGLIVPGKVPQYLQIIDILMHTSLHEGLPRAAVQAFALEIPVIGFDIDGTRDVIKNNVNGFLIAPKNVAGLAAAALKLMENRKLAQRMGKQGADFVRDVFNLKTMIASIDFIYQDLRLCGK
ncbi:MAG: glycosyltransferase family 4 protein [Candidatus Omnitrophota bacterium]